MKKLLYLTLIPTMIFGFLLFPRGLGFSSLMSGSTLVSPPTSTSDTSDFDSRPTHLNAKVLAGSTAVIAVYDIKGQSKNLGTENKESILKWQQQLAQLGDKLNNDVIINGPTTDKLVALTFDDGPDNIITPQILDVLKRYSVHANFFFIGQQAKAYPRIVKRAYDEENLVLNHSYSHPNFYNKNYDFVNNELIKTDQILQNITGKIPALVRPPYGIITDTLLTYAKRNQKKFVIWSTDTFDWSQRDADNIVKNVLENARPGEIILMHNNSDKLETARALPRIIEGLQAQGYKIVTLDQLLNTNAYNLP